MVWDHGAGGSNPSTPTNFYANSRDGFGRLAQLGEHLPYKQRVTGSSPVAPTKNLTIKYAGVAQLAEQLICNQQVAGSSPITSSNGQVPEWPKGADCKSVACSFDGSNPSLPTKKKRQFSTRKLSFLFVLLSFHYSLFTLI